MTTFKQGDIVEFPTDWMCREIMVEAIFLRALPNGEALVSACGFFGPDSDDLNALQPIDNLETVPLTDLVPCLQRWPYGEDDA